MSVLSPREGYDLWAPTWDCTPSPIVALEERTMLPWIERLSPRRVLDIGCGTGRWTGRLRAIGIDQSHAMLEIAASKPGLRGRLAVADARLLPCQTASADAVVCALALCHIRDAAPAMQEFARVLEPRGTLLLSDFHPTAARVGWRRTFRQGANVFELESYPHTIPELEAAAPGLQLQDWAEAYIGEPERQYFEQAGRPELFAGATAIPAILISRWTRI